jgi:hypothetical protein
MHKCSRGVRTRYLINRNPKTVSVLDRVRRTKLLFSLHHCRGQECVETIHAQPHMYVFIVWC